MVSISQETPEQSDARLRKLISNSTFTVFPEAYTFDEFPLLDFPKAVDPSALALVRHADGWSQLVPCGPSSGERYRLFLFQFPIGVDDSGFIGWLATRLKRRLGTGVIVVCGHNSSRGGIFDYWGCPESLGDQLIAEVRSLMSSAANDGSA